MLDVVDVVELDARCVVGEVCTVEQAFFAEMVPTIRVKGLLAARDIRETE